MDTLEAKDPREALITTVEEDTTVVIAMEVEDTIPRVAKEETVDTMVVVTIQRVAKEVMVDTMVVVTIQKEVRVVEIYQSNLLLLIQFRGVCFSQFIRCNCGYWSIHFSHSKKECQ